MKIVTVLAVMVLAAATAFAGSLKLGDKAPMTDTKMKSVDGKDVTIAGVAGKDGTLVIFTCNHCPFAKAWEKRIAELGNAYGKKGIGVIAINSNDPSENAEDSFENMQKHAKDAPFEFPYAVDATSDVARAFGASRTPEVFLFNKEGKLVYHGAVDDNRDAPKVTQSYLKEALDDVVAGKPVTAAETKAVGCTIKFHAKA
jgi:glutathione peroxidase-family protein